jgi:uncharacterized protein YjbI with pentapeptide repeats
MGVWRDRRQRGSLPLGRPMLLACVAAVLLVACVFVLPPLLVPAARSVDASVGPLDRARLENERTKLRNDARTTLLQAFGGAFFLSTALLTWRQIQVTREGQLTDRFSRAIEHLGTEDKLEVRLGGIYALERIAIDAPGERRAILEILAAYVRRHASRPSATGPGSESAHAAGLPPLRVHAPDLQAVMTVLGRRRPAGDDAEALHLAGVDLRKATLPDANLRGANLSAADLSGIDLRRADLREVDLRDAELHNAGLAGARLAGARMEHANLRSADLAGADLAGAHLEHASLREASLVQGKLDRADLGNANLGEARLQEATLREARLRGTNLWGASLVGADLRGADLEGCTLVRALLAGALLDGANLHGVTLDGVDLAGARADRTTAWPAGFDWRSAGVVVENRSAGARTPPRPPQGG